jgi:steroid delta-isomerase-like uncharacterized protein
MTVQEINQKLTDAFNSHDADAVAALFTEDAVVLDPQYAEPLRGKDAIRKDIADFFTAFPDIQSRPGDLLASGDTAATEYHMTGTHKGPMVTPDGDIAATGRNVKVTVALFTRLNGQGLITEQRRYFDLAGLVQQLGL